MSLVLRRILAEISDPSRAGQTITLRDATTQAVISSVTLDGAGAAWIPLSWEQFLAGAAGAHAGAQGTAALPGTQTGGAGGDAEGQGTLSQQQPLAGAAQGHGGAGAAPTESAPGGSGGTGGGQGTLGQALPISGTAAGHGDASAGTPSQIAGGEFQGSAGGHAGASATPTVVVPLGGSAGGSAGAGPSPAAQEIPIAGAGAGHGSGAGALTQGTALGGAAAGQGAGSGATSQDFGLAGAGGGAAATGATVTVVAGAATNILPDPSFETLALGTTYDVTKWAKAGGVADPLPISLGTTSVVALVGAENGVTPYDGSKMLKLHGEFDGSLGDAVAETIITKAQFNALVEGKLRLRCCAQGMSGTIQSGQPFVVRVRILNSSKATVSGVYANLWIGTTAAQASNTTNDTSQRETSWTPLAAGWVTKEWTNFKTFVTNAFTGANWTATSYVAIKINAGDIGGGPVTVYVDDVSLT